MFTILSPLPFPESSAIPFWSHVPKITPYCNAIHLSFAPCSSYNPSQPPLVFHLTKVSAFCCDESTVHIFVLLCKLCWSVSPHTHATARLATANRMNKASFLRVFSSEKGLIRSFSFLYQLLIFIKLLREEDFWDLYPEGIVRCGWNWLAGSRSLGSGLTDRLVAWLHYFFP